MKKNISQDTRLLHEIRPCNLLSFGPETNPLALESLNILIGPNGAGKSNLIEAISLLRATPGDIHSVVRRGGGVAEWIWKGGTQKNASIDVVVHYQKKFILPLRHFLTFGEDEHKFKIVEESIEDEASYFTNDDNENYYYRFQDGESVIITGIMAGQRYTRHMDPSSVNTGLSILAQRRDPEHYPEISYLSDIYEKIRIYREWTFGRNTVFREPQMADMRNDRLEEDFSNLGLFLNRLRRSPKAKSSILEGLRDLYNGVSDFDVSIEGGAVQVFFTEGDFTIPATRLSDGTLRYLCLLAILCDPDPPPLICIEEPELGLHPDILPKLADQLAAASERTQIIVTTHSDILVDAMTERPEAVVVCEKDEGKTSMRRLEKAGLEGWLEKYRLGQLWTKGQIGGTRW